MIRKEVQEEAELILREGGEVPEVAFWNSYFYLTENPEGPILKLSSEEREHLKEAVIKRYLMIIERDLTVQNIGRPCYRGISRARTNWQRLRNFLEKQGISVEPFRQILLRQLDNFLGNLPQQDLLYLEALKFKKELEGEANERRSDPALCDGR